MSRYFQVLNRLSAEMPDELGRNVVPVDRAQSVPSPVAPAVTPPATPQPPQAAPVVTPPAAPQATPHNGSPAVSAPHAEPAPAAVEHQVPPVASDGTRARAGIEGGVAHQEADARTRTPSATRPTPTARAARAPGLVPDRFTAVLDRLHECTGKLVGGSVVVAPVSSPDALSRVVNGVAAEAERAGLKTLTMQAVPRDGGLALEFLPRHGSAAGTRAPARLQRVVCWGRGGSEQDIKAWLDDVRRIFDFIVVAAPPFAATPDSSRLAHACDGLVLVAQAHVTQRQDLEIAAEHARIADCTVLGIVFAEPRQRFKEWLGIV